MGRTRLGVGRGHSWTEAEEVLLCRLRLAGMSVSALAATMSRLIGEPVTGGAVTARLTRRGVRTRRPARWVEEERMFSRVAAGEMTLEEAFEECERTRAFAPERLRRWRWSQTVERQVRWAWRREHLSDVPADAARWADYRSRLLVEWGPPVVPEAWREDAEFLAVARTRWPAEAPERLALRHEGWLAARGG